MASSESRHPPATISTREGPELGRTDRSHITKSLNSDYPLIDSDPHFYRVLRYARTSDYITGAVAAAAGPAAMWYMEHKAPTGAGKRGIATMMRLSGFVGVTAGFLLLYSRSTNRFYGFSENRREIEMDMREMVDKVKKGEPLYGKSTMTDYMQGVASRQSRYTGVWLHVMPWFNFVNHPHHGVDTAKYYRQAELELEAGRK